MTDSVARYYDSNTRRFLLVGSGGGSYAIHRELWGPGVTTTAQAAEYINRLVGDEIAAAALGPAPLVADLGCGVGGTVFSLADRFPEARCHGITISPRQREIARRVAERRGLEERVEFSQGDFQAIRLEPRADVAIAIESFAHSDTPDRFFAAAAANMREGGTLILVDDFVSLASADLDIQQRRAVADFRAGWRLPSLSSPSVVGDAARRAGFQLMKQTDLTPLIRPGRLRDRVIAVIGPGLRRMGLVGVPFFGNMIGGNALQIGLKEGFFQYLLQVWSKPSQDG